MIDGMRFIVSQVPLVRTMAMGQLGDCYDWTLEITIWNPVDASVITLAQVFSGIDTLHGIQKTPKNGSKTSDPMKKLLVVIFGSLRLSLSAQDITFITPGDEIPTDLRLGELTKAAGFVRTQDKVLQKIAADLPELATDVGEAVKIFQASALGKGASHIAEQFTSEPEKEFLAASNRASDARFETMKESMAFTPETAAGFIDQVNKRSRGSLPADVRATLLALDPDFVHDPLAEFKAGWHQKFSLADHPKGNRIPMQVELPLSWRGKDDPKEIVAKIFRSGEGRGPIICGISAVRIPESDQDRAGEDLAARLQRTVRKRFSGEEETELLENKVIDIDNLPAVTFTFVGNQSLTGVDERSIVTTYGVFHNGWMITIGFNIAPRELGDESLEEAYKRFLPVYKAVVGSVTIE